MPPAIRVTFLPWLNLSENSLKDIPKVNLATLTMTMKHLRSPGAFTLLSGMDAAGTEAGFLWLYLYVNSQSEARLEEDGTDVT